MFWKNPQIEELWHAVHNCVTNDECASELVAKSLRIAKLEDRLNKLENDWNTFIELFTSEWNKPKPAKRKPKAKVKK